MIQTQQNGETPHFGPDLDPLDLNFSRQFLFSRIWLCPSLDIMVSYPYVKHKKKTNDPILRRFSDGRTDGQTNGRE